MQTKIWETLLQNDVFQMQICIVTPIPKILNKVPILLRKKKYQVYLCMRSFIISFWTTFFILPFTTSSKESLYSYHNEPRTPFFVSSVVLFLFLTSMLLHYRSFCLESHLPPLDKFYPLRSTAGITSSQETFLSPSSQSTGSVLTPSILHLTLSQVYYTIL